MLMRLVIMLGVGISVEIRMLVVYVRVGHASDRTGSHNDAARQRTAAGNA
jgi:hypothetical protein